MRSLRHVVALAKSAGRSGNVPRTSAGLQSAQRYELHHSVASESSVSQSSVFPSSVFHRPWLPTVIGNRCVHSSGFERQIALEEASVRSTPEISKAEAHLPATKQGEKPRVVVLGTGWAGCRFMKDLNTKVYDIVCISPRNHMVFTPLLASTCVGTLEFRSVAGAVRSIQPALAREPNSFLYLARCTQIDTENRQIHCGAVGKEETADMQTSGQFSVAYDKLVIASDAESLTFGIAGVPKHAIYLRTLGDARAIRQKLLLNLGISDVPGVTEEEKQKILHCVVVGGGPTGVEFAGELSDFIARDVIQKFSHVKDYIRVTLIEANEILSAFEVGLREYATSQLEKSGVKLVKGMVKDVQADKLVLSDGSEVPYGLLVWSTGVGPSEFVKSLPFQKSPSGRVGVDEYLRVVGQEDVFAIGDCSGYVESTGKSVLPALAQVADRQGTYLAKSFNSLAKEGVGRAGGTNEKHFGKPFVYKHLGNMANVGRYKALVDLRESKTSKGISISGFTSWLIWRSAYFSRVISMRNRIYVAVNWATALVFGRDVSRF